MCDTLAEIRTHFYRIIAMGKLEEDDILVILLLNSMHKHFGPLQQDIMCSSININSELIITRLLAESK